MLCFFILNGILQVCIFLYCIKFINFQVLIHSSFKFCRCNLDILTETRDGEAREFWELRVPPYCFFFWPEFLLSGCWSFGSISDCEPSIVIVERLA